MFSNVKSCITALCCLATLLTAAGISSSCQQVANLTKPAAVAPASLRDVPAQRLSFRFEPDVLAPPEPPGATAQTEKLTAIQADFDQSRPQEVLERTISSPDKQRVLAIYQSVADEKGEFRLDLYEASGKPIHKITPENLALVFPDSVVWSPDGNNFAFAGSQRQNSPVSQEILQEAPRPPDLDNDDKVTNANTPDANSSTANSNLAPTNSPSPAATAAPPVAVLTFRTEQIYFANRDGGELKPLTQTEGLIYYYFVWSPDGTQLAALACKENEWQALQMRAEQRGEIFKPFGRPRLLEKNGRERRLDDALTAVNPVWSPDSSKTATAFDKQVRVYDAIGNNPTAAALPLQVPLLIAAKICDDKVAGNQSCVNVAPSEINSNIATNLPTTEPTTFVPIISLRWTDDKTLYLQTGFVKEFTQGEPVRSYLRWHRLNFSPQAATLK